MVRFFRSFIFLLIIIPFGIVSAEDPVLVKGIHLHIYFYDYDNSSAIHEGTGAPTVPLYNSLNPESLNTKNYLSLQALLAQLRSMGLEPKGGFENLLKTLNDQYQLKMDLLKTSLPSDIKVTGSSLRPLDSTHERNQWVSLKHDPQPGQMTLVKELASIPLYNASNLKTLDLTFPQDVKEPGLYFLSVYVSKNNMPGSEERSAFSFWHLIRNGAINFRLKRTETGLEKLPKTEKILTPLLNGQWKGEDLHLSVVLTDFVNHFLPEDKKIQIKNAREVFVRSIKTQPQLPSLKENTVDLFFVKNAEEKIVKKVTVQTGDILLRLGTDIHLAFASTPIPPDLSDDPLGKENWKLFAEAVELLFSQNLISKRYKLEELFLEKLREELSNNFNNGFATYSKNTLLTQEERAKRNALETLDLNGVNFDNDPSNDTGYYNRFDPDHRSPFTFGIEELMNEDELRENLHYFEGIPFFSHSAILSVEKNPVTGKKEVWIYDAFPSTKDFPRGIRRVPFKEMFGKKQSSYGVILRIDEKKLHKSNLFRNVSQFGLALAAVNQARSTFFETYSSPGPELFDYGYDWKNPDKLGCSEFVWLNFGMGALSFGIPNFNLVPNLSMLRTPLELGHAIGQNVKNFFQITPPDLALSPFVERVVDFDSQKLNSLIQAFSDTGDAQDVTDALNLKHSSTGHGFIFLY
ncbi:MAG TPA: hypothetical protein VJL87_03430 [Bdellovibrionota bacterium]|nr:hypothetical protein [Bdellovibrionota bacterium]